MASLNAAVVPPQHPPLSPASSIASLPVSDDISDFSDSDFDIISNSDSTPSGEEGLDRTLAGRASGRRSRSNLSSTDEETDDEWYGVVDSQRIRTSPLPVPEAEDVSGAAASTTGLAALSEEDASVIDALSQSLERSEESIRAFSTPLNGSIANMRFPVSPSSSMRRTSASTVITPLSRSATQRVKEEAVVEQLMGSPSSEVLQLAFPDPLSPSQTSLIAPPEQQQPPQSIQVPETNGDKLGDQHELTPESVLPDHSSPAVKMLEPIIPLAATDRDGNQPPVDDHLVGAKPEDIEAVILEQVDTISLSSGDDATVAVITSDDEDIQYEDPQVPIVGEEDAAALYSRYAASGAVYRPFFDGFDDYLAVIIKQLSANIAGNRWTASVIVSVLALVIGGLTYVGTPSSTAPTPTSSFSPSFLIPSSTLWGIMYPLNKSSIVPPQPSPVLTSAPAADDVGASAKQQPCTSELGMFSSWALSVAPSPSDFDFAMGVGMSSTGATPPPTGPRGVKRKRGGSAPPKESASGIREPVQAPACAETASDPEPEHGSEPLLLDAPLGLPFHLPHLKTALSAMLDSLSSSSPSSSHYDDDPYTDDPPTPFDLDPTLDENLLALPFPLADLPRLMKDTLLPVAQHAYDALSSDVGVLISALDELLSVLRAQAAELTYAPQIVALRGTIAESLAQLREWSSAHGAGASGAEGLQFVMEGWKRGTEEATYRHARAKANAKRLKKKGAEMLEALGLPIPTALSLSGSSQVLKEMHERSKKSAESKLEGLKKSVVAGAVALWQEAEVQFGGGGEEEVGWEKENQVPSERRRRRAERKAAKQARRAERQVMKALKAQARAMRGQREGFFASAAAAHRGY
ncbi:hypothetical protein DL93DRAFT_2166114 [Clavulina sp. PMI_390]|nr:hypothetical protein DL93DRAFT_2166114 [Clavulina sp. PMI_390]